MAQLHQFPAINDRMVATIAKFLDAKTISWITRGVIASSNARRADALLAGHFQIFLVRRVGVVKYFQPVIAGCRNRRLEVCTILTRSPNLRRGCVQSSVVGSTPLSRCPPQHARRPFISLEPVRTATYAKALMHNISRPSRKPVAIGIEIPAPVIAAT